jgi:predicted RNA-binding protein with PIN domain
VAVAIDGEQADPRVPAPTALRPVLGFTRLSAASYGLIERVVDGDATFRARVAAAADEAQVGRAGWLWLTRPEGWERDPALAADARPGAGSDAAARLRRERAGAEAAAARHRREAEAAGAARRQAELELAAAHGAVARVAAADAEVARLAGRVDELTEERTQLVRRLKAAEAEATALRRDLKVAREATRQAEAELLARASGSADDGSHRDHLAARAALESAAGAVDALARSLDDAAAALGATPGAAAPEPTTRGGRRRPPPLPGGLAADSPEAHRHLVAASGALVVVDGYNLARTAWADLAPEEERRRTVALLEEHRARTGVPITVVFDGDSSTVAPAASRSVRVRYSPTDRTADEAIAELLATLPATQPVVVVSSDREVADDARRQGAAVLGAAAFLAAAGR